MVPDTDLKQVLVLGASRGLGAALVRTIAAHAIPVTGFSRRPGPSVPGHTHGIADFSTPAGQDKVLQTLAEQPFYKIIYAAGGGPYGLFHQREWKDHQWALQVSFLFPARLAHAVRQMGNETQLIFVGSGVAESSPDPKAASYSAAKHALKGLVANLRAESPNWDIRLFSPGYMDTEMLPKNAAVRQKGVYDPAKIAEELWAWSLRPDPTGHRLYPAHPDC